MAAPDGPLMPVRMFGDLPLSHVLIVLVGLPLAAAVGAWLLAGRKPQVIARQPLD
jgi:putative ABC transport system permease protein